MPASLAVRFGYNTSLPACRASDPVIFSPHSHQDVTHFRLFFKSTSHAATHLVKKAGRTHKTAHTGAVTQIQRFGSALNIHFHMLFPDGVYIDSANGSAARFQWVKAPTSGELTQLVHTIAQRIGRFLERQGIG